MTKIPSVEELINKMQVGECITGFQKADLLTALTDERTTLLTELREWARSKKGMKSGNEQSQMYWHGHADVLFALEAHINNLINPTN